MITPPRVVYQIFPDRFAIGGAHTFASKLARPDHRGFERAPSWEARPRPTGRELFGGDLDGITENLAHVRSLGADALYLTPIFESPSSHRYDASDFSKVDARLGGEAAWERLVAATRAEKIGVILDVVVNHVGEEHVWFREAREQPSSPRRGWFTFDSRNRYVSWRGHGHLPELRLEDPGLRAELLHSPTGVVRHWLRRGASGWRVDCANDLGIPFCRELREVVSEERAPFGLIGELVSWGGDHLAAGALDGVMNYPFRDAVVAALTGEIPGETGARNLEVIARGYPRAGLLQSWNVLGTHDTPRLRTVLGDRERVLMAYLLAFTFPGVPLVYYGDEIGLEGGEDPDNRRGMVWDRTRWDHPTLERVQRLASLRRELPALTTGEYVPLLATGVSTPRAAGNAVLAFLRASASGRDGVLVVANTGDRAVSARVVLPRAEYFDSLPLVDRLGSSQRVFVKQGSVRLDLPAFGGVVLVPEPRDASGYDFWKRV